MSSVLVSSPITGFHPSVPRDYEAVTLGEVRREYARLQNYLQGTASDWLPSSDAALRMISSECQTPNWDGRGAVAITHDLISVAGLIVDVLYRMVPAGMPPPDIVPETDGEISLSWMVDDGRVFSLSIGTHGKMNFAGQFGDQGSIHGWRPIDACNQSRLQSSLQEIAGYLENLHPPVAARRAA